MRAASLIVGLCIGATVLPAQAQDKNPGWLKRPRAEDLYAVWPKEAWRQGLGGRAVIACQVTVQGALTACNVVSESPEGSGFGAAAIALTPQFLMTPRIVNGQPVTGTARIPITFLPPEKPTGSHNPGIGTQLALNKRVVSNVRWLQAPSYNDVVASYSENVRAPRPAGRATLECEIGRSGRLSNCTTLTEEPKGKGLAKAARGLTAAFQAPETSADGQPLQGARVHLAFTFDPDMLASSTPVIGKPTWTALPTAAELAAGFPAEARQAGAGTGRIRLRCGIGEAGRLSDCEVLSEDPPQLGFGAAALVLARSFQMSLWTAEGLPTVGGVVTVPVRYELTSDPGRRGGDGSAE